MPYREGRKIGSMVQRLLQTSGISLNQEWCIRELAQFQEYYKDYRVVVFSGFNCEDIIFDGQAQPKKELNFFMRKSHVITI